MGGVVPKARETVRGDDPLPPEPTTKEEDMPAIFTPGDLREMERAVSDCCGIGSLCNDWVEDVGGPESGPSLSVSPSGATMLHHLIDVAAWIGTPDFRAQAGPYFGSRQPLPEGWDEPYPCYVHDISVEHASA